MKKSRYFSRRMLPMCLAVIVTTGFAMASAIADPVKAIDIPQLQSLINSNKGKVTVVNFWATWCPPCLKEFPDIIKFYNAYHAKGVEVVAVSMNEPDEMEDIEDFLQENKPPFPVYMAASQDETFYSGIGHDWEGLIPLTMIFDAEGNNTYFHLKEVNFEGLEKDVTGLLPKSE